MVRRLWANRLIQALTRPFRLFLRWLLVWVSHLFRRTTRSLRVAGGLVRMLLRPRDPNNLYVEATDGAYERVAALADPLTEIATGEQTTTLLWAGSSAPRDPGGSVSATALSLWKGTRAVSVPESASGTAAANRRYAYVDLMASLIKRLSPKDIKLLEELIQRLARKWLDIEEAFHQVPRRNRLDIGRTLRHNIPLYAGAVLNFRWATKEHPIPRSGKPARLLVIGDVSHSMAHYVSLLLYFFHSLNFRFVVESYVFSEKATYSTPYLNGIGTFEEKVQRLIHGARSWNAGTRFGSALEEIAREALVDENTYVLIATDGKVSLQSEEAEKIKLYMGELRKRTRQVIFITPSAEFSNAGSSHATKKQYRLGSLKYDFHEVPIWSMGSPLWYGTLGQYADRLYLVRTVQDLIDMTENLLISSHPGR